MTADEIMLLRKILKYTEDNYGKISDRIQTEIKDRLNEHKITEKDEKNAVQDLAVLMKRIHEDYRSARNLAEVFGLSFTLDFIQLERGSLIFDGKDNRWNSSTLECMERDF